MAINIKTGEVLILVLLELILLLDLEVMKTELAICFNPCFIGTYSFTCKSHQ